MTIFYPKPETRNPKPETRNPKPETRNPKPELPVPQIICKAIIFDLDGILVNSNPIAERHWTIWAERHGIPAEQILSIHHGRPTVQTIQAVAPHLDAAAEAARKEKIEADDVDGLTKYPGTFELLTSLPEDRWAIATSGTRRTATKRLLTVGLPIPKVMITADDVSMGKPDPEPYLLAAAGLGLSATDCVVIEDAPAGIASARGAGATVIAVASTNGHEALGEANCIVPQFAHIQLLVEKDHLAIQL